ncbi:MAG: hypothetical protein IJT68_09095 [Lentisphaeria bacterium]|nr:hypothetical protein [Lentisphaeria bacterium]
MMKALLFCPVHGNAGLKQYFPDYPVYLLPFANKPAIEFELDFCFLSGIRDVVIVSDEESGILRSQYRSGETLGLNILCEGTGASTSLKRVIQQKKSFFRGCDLLVFSGLFLPEYDKRNPRELNVGADEVKGCSYGAAAWYLIGRDRLENLPDDWNGFHDGSPVNGFAVPDIRDYYRHNMRLAGSDIEKYNLPGFSEGRNSFVGRDVQIPGSARVKPPVILGNGIQFGRGVHAGPNIIVGDNCVIDNGTMIRDSIILGNTYVGRNLEINGKICGGNRLVDPETGMVIDVMNESVLSEIEQDEYGRCPLHQRALACLLLFLQALPYALLRPFLEYHSTFVECMLGNGARRTMSMNTYVLPRESFAGRLFRRLTLDKFHLLPHAVAGKVRLVGNYLLEANVRNEELIRNLPGYAPGIFSYSEYLGHENEPYQLELDEQYYAYAMNCWFNIKILTGILRRNLGAEGRPLQQRGVLE